MKKSLFHPFFLYNKDMNFVNLQKEIPDILLDIRYCSSYNFVGEVIDGYIDPIALSTYEMCQALKDVNEVVKAYGYRLKVYDAYRPQKAVNHFMRWAKDFNDTKIKSIFYPNIEKEAIFKEQYLIEKSGHSRGSTIDCTLFDDKKGCDLDMGSPFDLFDQKSHPLYTDFLNETQINNRFLLRDIMTSHGFIPLESEWWHFTLKDEPYPFRYFDFDIKAL